MVLYVFFTTVRQWVDKLEKVRLKADYLRPQITQMKTGPPKGRLFWSTIRQTICVHKLKLFWSTNFHEFSRRLNVMFIVTPVV